MAARNHNGGAGLRPSKFPNYFEFSRQKKRKCHGNTKWRTKINGYVFTDISLITGAAAVVPEPSEANITLLVDMGFPRQQAVEALREAHNDLSTATSILLRNT